MLLPSTAVQLTIHWNEMCDIDVFSIQSNTDKYIYRDMESE